MEIIYATKGKAKEYAPLAVELYSGCLHGCLYCYVPGTLTIHRNDFCNHVTPTTKAIARLKTDAEFLKKNRDDREILLCFESDPYQPGPYQPLDESQHIKPNIKPNITSQAITILRDNGLKFTVLTKNGSRAIKDFHLFERYEKSSFGSTIVFTEQRDADKWEPYTANIHDRILAVEEAHKRGIRTWISIEPVIDPKQALRLIKSYHCIVDHWKIGKINYHPEIEKKVDWIKFREDATDLLESLGASYYFKKSLTEFGK